MKSVNWGQIFSQNQTKILGIWQVKLKDKDKRHQEIMNASMDDFYDVRGEISEKYVVLKKHIQRIQTNQKKYGNK